MLANRAKQIAISSDRFITTSSKERELRMWIEILLPVWCAARGVETAEAASIADSGL
jgi:hypothetical protein